MLSIRAVILWNTIAYLLWGCNPIPLSNELDNLHYPVSIYSKLIITNEISVNNFIFINARYINTDEIDTLLDLNNLSYNHIQNLTTELFRFTSKQNLQYIDTVSIFLKSLKNNSDSILIASAGSFDTEEKDLEVVENTYPNHYLMESDTLWLMAMLQLKELPLLPDTLNLQLDLIIEGSL